ncbi:hypothetical protein CDO73_16285 [Saccharibacillus sp. O23]|nr:hypothetical protein CDO73_16285 [Saccharibacillus sp. O23]
MNYKHYEKYRKLESDTHRVGVTILQEYISTQLNLYKCKVQRGYLLKKEMDFVPDLSIEFSDGEVWVIDYITGSRNDNKYSKFLQNKITSYKAEGFRYFFIVNEDWQSALESNEFISFFDSEQLVSRITAYDEIWIEFIRRLCSQYGEEAIFRNQHDFSPDLSAIRTIVYFDQKKVIAKVMRYVAPLRYSKFNNWGRLIHPVQKVPLERIFTLDNELKDFLWVSHNEAELLNKFYHSVQRNALMISQKKINDSKNEYTSTLIRKFELKSNTNILVQAPIENESIVGDYSFKRRIEATSDLLEKTRICLEVVELCEQSEKIKEYPNMRKRTGSAKIICMSAFDRNSIDYEEWRSLKSEIDNLLSFIGAS